MTANDPFADAARAEAERRHPDSVDVETGEPVDDWGFEEQGRRDFRDGAKCARTHLAAQEPTDAEVEAAKAVLDSVEYADEPQSIRAALSAARAARRDEEKRDD